MSHRSNFTMDDDDDWQEMPVVRERSPASSPSSSDTEGGAPSGYGPPGASLASASKRAANGGSAASRRGQTSSSTIRKPPRVTDPVAPSTTSSRWGNGKGHGRHDSSGVTNATGRQLDIDDARGFRWRAKPAGLGEGAGGSKAKAKSKGKGKGGDDDDDGNEAEEWVAGFARPIEERKRQRSKLKPGESSGSSSSSEDDEEDDDEGGARGYTQLRVDEDVEGEELSAASEYLFAPGGQRNAENIASGEASSATPHSQLDTTKRLLSEGQKIAYVGLVSLVARDLIRMLQRVPGKELKAAIESTEEWRLRVMARLFQHMDIESSEQAMIHSLAQHGVLPTDLAPSLITTQTVDNPDFDPEAERERDEEREVEQREAEEEQQQQQPHEEPEVSRAPSISGETLKEESNSEKKGSSDESESDTKGEAPDLKSEEEEAASTQKGEEKEHSNSPPAQEEAGGDLGDLGDAGSDNQDIEDSMHTHEKIEASVKHDDQDDGGDLGTGASTPTLAGPSTPTTSKEEKEGVPPQQEEDAFAAAAASAVSSEPSQEEGKQSGILADPNTAAQVLGSAATADDLVEKTTPMGLTNQPQTIDTLPSALEGVTTELSSADRKITLDLRWTVLCDLFLVLTADSVYDSRSRVLLEKVAEHLGLAWMDVTKFEKRVTDALEIEEGVAGSLRGKKAVKKRAEAARRRRLVMMGLATVGGGLVIGLSAGVMAPFIGAGLGAALGTIGVGGTTGFLGGVGGAAIITTTGTVGGAALGGRGMSRRTKSVKTFEFKPIHNNKRVNCIVTVGGFMNGPQDDPRLPFSIVDSIMGDVFSVLWEPEMMQEMGDAIYLLWNETIVQGLQQVLAATIAGGLVGALAWPLWLTKLGWFIDNPWSNALDRAHACGLILADVLSRRQLGVRPITLVGFSLGARAIFYCLVELAQKKKFGIVQNVYLMGAPVTASDKTWKEARAVVAGRFVNAFSRTDWILGYLFRATTGGLRSIAGLHPVERVPEVENVDVTQTVPGHLQYRAFMPLVLDELGFRTTADYFDEPEDLSKIPEREFVYDQEEPEAVKEMKSVHTSSGGFGKIFRRNKTANGSSSSSSNDTSFDKGAGPSIKAASSSSATPSKLAAEVSSAGGKNTAGDDDDDDDELPPREEHFAEPKTPTLSQPTLPPPPSKIPPQTVMSSGDPDLDAILAELRESGIEVKELQSSLPPLPLASPAPSTPVGGTKATLSGPKDVPKDEKEKTVSSLEPPSTAATRANLPRMQSQPTPQAVSPSLKPEDGLTKDEQQQQQPSPRPRLPYAKSFASSVFDADELPPPPPPYSFTSSADANDVSLSFGSSYDDDDDLEQEVQQTAASHTNTTEEEARRDESEAELERIASGKAYGLSEDTAKELARQFQSSGMSSQGARAAAKMAQTLGQHTGGSEHSPRSASEAATSFSSPAALDPWSSTAGDGDGDEGSTSFASTTSSSSTTLGYDTLSAPERSFSFGRQTEDDEMASRGGMDFRPSMLPQHDSWGGSMMDTTSTSSAYTSPSLSSSFASSSTTQTPHHSSTTTSSGFDSNPWG